MFSLFRGSKTAWPPGADFVGVFLVALVLYGIVNASPTFLDPDSFYHLKITEIMMADGVVRVFPWLPFTTLAHAYADHHFLYHVLLMPFVALYGSFTGAKVATVVLAAGAVTAFYAMLKAYGSRLPFAFAMLLGTSYAFLFRMNLTKTSAVSVLTLMLALIAIRKNRPVALFFLAWAYVLLYGGWPILAVIVGVFLASRVITDRLVGKHPLHSWGSAWFWRRLFAGRRNAVADFLAVPEARHAIAAIAGLTCGLVINPYFPANLRFYWEQIVQIAVVNYQEVIGVGVEWYPYPASALYVESGGIFLAASGCVVLLLAMVLWSDLARRRASATHRADVASRIASVILALLFLLMTMRSRRHVEYFSPFAVMAVALLFTSLYDRANWQNIAESVRNLAPRRFRDRLRLDAALFVAVIALFAFLGTRNVITAAETYRGGIPWNRYEQTAAWLKENVPAGEIIVHSDWDQFPPLFYHDAEHRYMCGLDPTFLYRQDPVRYHLWADVTRGKVTEDVAEKVRDGLNARYFVVDSRYEAMRKALERDPNIMLLHHDADADVYGIR